ncbi:MAG: hydrophobic protein [Thermoleophilia bacterium]
MLALLVVLALAILIFGIVGVIKIAAWLALFIVLGVVLLAVLGAGRLRGRGGRTV